jgi:hypothetical protein
VSLLAASSIIAIIPSAFALTRYFNCTTQIANKTGKLTFDDVNYCYDVKFPSKSNSSSNNNNNNNNRAIYDNASQGSDNISFSHDHAMKSKINIRPPEGFIFPITNP